MFENAWLYKLKRMSLDGIGLRNVALGIFKESMHVFAVGMKLVPSTNLIEGCNAKPNTGSSSVPVEKPST